MTSNSERLFAPPPDDIDQMFAEVAHEIGPDPAELAREQATRARTWMADMAAGKGIASYFRTIRDLLGRYLPGAYFVGGYAKTAKTTLVMTEARAQAEAGIPTGVVGTEQAAEVLRLQSAAIQLGLRVSDVVAASPERPLSRRDTERVHADLERQTALAKDGLLFYAEDHDQTLPSALYWLRWCQRNGAKMVVYDHIHRMDLGAENYYQALPNAVRALTTFATTHDVVLLCAAQLREDSHDKLANHEPPGDRQWFGTSAFQREATAALQLYRPFRAGVTNQQKQAVKLGETRLSEILAADTVGLRCSVHRYLNTAGELRRLKIVEDQITDWPDLEHPPAYESPEWQTR